jgi:hypothetical protein
VSVDSWDPGSSFVPPANLIELILLPEEGIKGGLDFERKSFLAAFIRLAPFPSACRHIAKTCFPDPLRKTKMEIDTIHQNIRSTHNYFLDSSTCLFRVSLQPVYFLCKRCSIKLPVAFSKGMAAESLF